VNPNPHNPKHRTTLGMWAMVGGPSTTARKVFIPAHAVLAEALPQEAYMVPIVAYVDGSPVAPGMVAVIKRSVHTPDLVVGMARLMGAHLVDGEDDV
jgi:hypothetical protein